jgi:phosphatidylglycerophosphate synthase
MTQEAGNRRPLTSRNTAWAKALAAFLGRHNVNPNFISILSILFALGSAVSFYLVHHFHYSNVIFMLVAAACIQLRLLMNLLDGMVAIEYNKKSALGGLFNEVPDRIADTLIIVGAGTIIKDMQYGMDMAYLAAILAIATAYIRALGASLNCGSSFLGPMAKPHRMAMLTGSCIVAIWYTSIFYYIFIIMNIGLLITCYRRLNVIAKCLKSKPQ